MAITFKRTLHPVGQGAFFTEQFFDEDSKKTIFNVVYDCGSFTNGNLITTPDILINSVDSFFSTTRHTIDLLFISHFDGDHINGVRYLLKKKYIDYHTTVVVPFKYAKALIALNVVGNVYSHIALLIKELMDNSIHIIGINDDGDTPPEGNERYVTIESLHSLNTISNGAKLVYPIHQGQEEWHYVPFLIKRRSSLYLEKFKQRIETLQLTLEQLSDSQVVLNNLERIREASHHSGSGNTINMHSLQLLSFCNNKKREESSCLYTGDTNLANRYYYDKEMDFVNYWLKSIGLMQIPHHGSKRNYPCLISLDDRVVCAFVNYQQNYRQKIFDSDILYFFSKVGKQLDLITENSNSEYQFSIEL